MEKTKVDIWGCCVSRDVFGFFKDEGYEVGVYTGVYSPVTQFQKMYPRVRPDIVLDEFPDADHKFLKKVVMRNFNKHVDRELEESGSEWLIVDMKSTTYDFYEVCFENGDVELTMFNNQQAVTCLSQALGSRGDVYTLKKIQDDAVLDPVACMDRFAEFAKKRYGNRIILVEVRESLEHLDHNGKVRMWDVESRKKIGIEYAMGIRFIEKTGCYYVKCPLNILGDDLHPWGILKVHYVQEFYEYVKSVIDYIVNTENPDPRTIDLMYMKACMEMNSLRSEEISLNRRPDKRINTFLKRGKVDEAVEFMDSLRASGNSAGSIAKARLYLEGKHVPKDIGKALEYYGEIEDDTSVAVRALHFDILWAMETVESDAKAVDEVFNSSEPEMVARLGRLYQEGRGLPKDLDLARSCFESAKEDGVEWVSQHLIKVLLDIDTSDAVQSAIDCLKELVEEGDKKSMVTLAKLYSEGKQIGKSIPLALELCRCALKDNKKPSTTLDKMYVGMLTKLDTPDADKELFGYFESVIGFRNEHTLRLSRMYKDGKGVDRNLEKALVYSRKAVDLGIPGSKMELAKQLLKTDDENRHREAVTLLIELDRMGVVDATDRLARSYFDGKGVGMDREKAERLFMVARERGLPEAGKNKLGY
ncbi:MAG: SEL1-like repeat protein [archaeon]|nr:SEL1-like repeat protein [archaeon]